MDIIARMVQNLNESWDKDMMEEELVEFKYKQSASLCKFSFVAVIMKL